MRSGRASAGAAIGVQRRSNSAWRKKEAETEAVRLVKARKEEGQARGAKRGKKWVIGVKGGAYDRRQFIEREKKARKYFG